MNTGHGEKLSRAKERAIGALLACRTIADAAKVAGVSERTLRRWQKEAGFRDEYREARKRILESVLNELRRLSSDAAKTLGTIATSDDSPAGARVRAAEVILQTVLRGVEVEELSERLDQLERAAALLGEKE